MQVNAHSKKMKTNKNTSFGEGAFLGCLLLFFSLSFASSDLHDTLENHEFIQDLGLEVIEREPSEKSQSENLREDDILTSMKLNRKFAGTLAETIKEEPDVNVRSMGPAPARPVLKGLGSEHVTIYEDGGLSSDLSATSPDHAVASEIITLDEAELIRGPQILLYTFSAAGGVIDFNRKDIPYGEDSLKGIVVNTAETSQLGMANAVSLFVPIKKASVKAEVSVRRAGKLNTPKGTLENTQLKNRSGVIGLAIPFQKWNLGVSLRAFDSDYGIPGGFIGAHPNGVNIDLSKYFLTMQAYGPILNSRDSLTLTFRTNRYHHYEYECDTILGAEFALNQETFRAEVKTPRKWGLFGITYGIDLEHRSLDMGGYVFTPPTSSYAGAFFGSASFALGSSGTEVTLSARGGGAFFDPKYSAVVDSEEVISRKFLLGSFSAEALKRVGNGKFISLNIFRTSRAPTIEELYNQGPHLAAYTYEVGNEKLESEEGYGGEFDFRGYKNDWKIKSSVYTTWFNNYLTPRATGDTNWSQLLPIYKIQSGEALMIGGNVSIEKAPEVGLNALMNASYVCGWYLDENFGNMPQIPPFRLYGELAWSLSDSRFGANVTWNASQNKVDQFEESTPASVLLGVMAEKIFKMKRLNWKIVFRIDNLLDAIAYNHLSRLKSIMPEKGRNFTIYSQLIW